MGNTDTLRASERDVLSAIMRRTDPHTRRFDEPQSVVRRETVYSQRTVAAAFRSLREQGFLRVIATPGPPKSVVYEVREPPVAAEW